MVTHAFAKQTIYILSSHITKTRRILLHSTHPQKLTRWKALTMSVQEAA